MRPIGEAAEVDEEVDVDTAVALTVISLMMTIHSLALELLLAEELLKEKMVVSLQKGGHLVVLIVVVAEVASAMEKWVKMDAHGEYLNVAVGLDAGVCY